MATIYTTAQQKGGVGKTTTAVNLAAVAGDLGLSALLVDTDPQFAATRRSGAPRDFGASLVDVLAADLPVREAIIRGVHGFDVLPAHRELSSVSVQLAQELGRERFLARALLPVDTEYDVIIIDTPPNLDLLTVNALFCSDVVVAPVSAEDEGAAQGALELRAVLKRVVENLRPGSPLMLVGLLTRWLDGRKQARDIAEAMEQFDVPIAAKVKLRADVQQADGRAVPFVVQHDRDAADAAEAMRSFGRALFDGEVDGQQIRAELMERVG